MRHFAVEEPLPTGWRTAAQLHEWRQRYDASEPIAHPLEPGTILWHKCLSSDLKRAYMTAQKAYSGSITQTPLLREAEFSPFRTGRLQLPIRVWHWMLRAAWMTSHASQRQVRDDFRRRVKAVADLLHAEEGDTLVVSHAVMMMYLRRELLQRGFRGPEFTVADHARVYLFERAL
jgi:broad specificity phosphatase PhoE